jgi:MFS family permease
MYVMHVLAESSPFFALRHRGFRLFWAANLISGCGIWVQNLAIGWMLARYPQASILLGLYGFATLAPIFALSLFGGTLADRVDRRSILLVTQSALMVLALALGVLTWLDIVRPWHLLAAALLTGVAVAMTSPAYQALIPDLVPSEDLTRAIALNSIQFNVARIVGHALAGLVVVWATEAGCFLLNALSYVAMLYALLRIGRVSGHRAKDTTPFLVRAKEGVGYLLTQRASLQLILTVGCVSLLGLPYFFFLPKFADDVLHVGVGALGFLTAAVSAGALFGALVVARIVRKFDQGGVVITSVILFWLHLIGFSMSRNYWLSCCLLIGMGFWLVLTITTVNSMLQHGTPPEMRGRVMSIYGVALNGLAPIGSVCAGALASVMPLPLAIAGMAGCGALASTIVLATNRRSRCAVGDSSMPPLSA